MADYLVDTSAVTFNIILLIFHFQSTSVVTFKPCHPLVCQYFYPPYLCVIAGPMKQNLDPKLGCLCTSNAERNVGLTRRNGFVGLENSRPRCVRTIRIVTRATDSHPAAQPLAHSLLAPTSPARIQLPRELLYSALNFNKLRSL